MYLNYTVNVPAGEKGITRKTIKGTTYIYYETGRTYDKEKKHTVPQTTTMGRSAAIIKSTFEAIQSHIVWRNNSLRRFRVLRLVCASFLQSK